MLNVLLFDVILPSSQSSEIWNWAAELRNLGWIDWGFWFAFVVPKINTYTYMRKYTFVSVSWAIYLYVYTYSSIYEFNIYNCILTLRTIIRRYTKIRIISQLGQMSWDLDCTQEWVEWNLRKRERGLQPPSGSNPPLLF